MARTDSAFPSSLDERAGKGLPAVSLDSLRAIVRTDLMKELEDKRQANMRPATRPAPKTPPRPARFAPSPSPVAPPKAGAPAPSPIVLAERARAQAILSMTPKGAEAEADKAIRSACRLRRSKAASRLGRFSTRGSEHPADQASLAGKIPKFGRFSMGSGGGYKPRACISTSNATFLEGPIPSNPRQQPVSPSQSLAGPEMQA